jgi:hypothetical protein
VLVPSEQWQIASIWPFDELLEHCGVWQYGPGNSLVSAGVLPALCGGVEPRYPRFTMSFDLG